MKKDSTMERLLNEMSEQLKFENLVPEEKKTPEIIPILPGEFQPRKVEDVIPDDDIQPDTYMIYPTGGYHPFYGVPNTFPIYQLPIWPFVKRIKFSDKYKSIEKINNARRGTLRENQNNTQLNPSFTANYLTICLLKEGRTVKNAYTKFNKNGTHQTTTTHRSQSFSIHRLVAQAWIPNPENKPQVMHINDDRTNYLRENLKWGTHSENMRGVVSRRPDTMEQKYLNLVDKGVIKG